MILIAAADRSWAIGKDGDLLLRIPEDMKEFARKTTGHVIVMGRKTLESFPGSKPLPGRTNIVLTGNPAYDGKGAIVVNSRSQLFEELEKYHDDEIYVTGGESIYRMLLPYCDLAYITRIDHEFQADTWMPDLDELDEWEIEQTGQEMLSRENIPYRFVTYRNNRPKRREC